MWGRTRLAGVAVIATVLASACASGHQDETASSPPPSTASSGSAVSNADSANAIRPVSLPDLSGMDESVQAQLRERYASLEQKIEAPGTPPNELAAAYGEMGQLLMAAESLDAAEPFYLNARALAPADVRWPYYLAHLHRKKGDSAKSAALFEEVLRLRPDDVPTLIWLGESHLNQGRPDAAEAMFAKAISLDPRSATAAFGLGRAALNRKDYARAVEHLENALALDPLAAHAHYPLAMAYRGLGNTASAEAHLKLRQRGDFEIAPPDPLMQELSELLHSPLAYEMRGMRALANGDWAGAARDFRKGLELEPDHPALRHRLGTALFQMGDARGAFEQFQEVLRRSPDFAKAHYSLGLMMQAAGQHDEAIARFSAAVKAEPAYVEARLRLAGALRQAGRMQESLAQYQAIIDMGRRGEAGNDPRVAEAPFGYAITLVRLGRYAEARDRLADGMKTYPDQPVYKHALARILSAAPDERVRDGKRAMALMEGLSDDERRIDGGETMAMTLAELGLYEQAAAWQRQVLAAAKAGGRGDMVPGMSQRLQAYERRTPWRSDDPIEFDGAGG